MWAASESSASDEAMIPAVGLGGHEREDQRSTARELARVGVGRDVAVGVVMSVGVRRAVVAVPHSVKLTPNTVSTRLISRRLTYAASATYQSPVSLERAVDPGRAGRRRDHGEKKDGDETHTLRVRNDTTHWRAPSHCRGDVRFSAVRFCTAPMSRSDHAELASTRPSRQELPHVDEVNL